MISQTWHVGCFTSHADDAPALARSLHTSASGAATATIRAPYLVTRGPEEGVPRWADHVLSEGIHVFGVLDVFPVSVTRDIQSDAEESG